MSINVKLLAQICEIPGTSGFEHDVRNFVKKENIIYVFTKY